ncbi:MAG: NPCBM/NEW2 domain-containing protein [Peptococcaceae bacterium]|nr:NPCBM/NEW2 domain-containing protein [Peptococcaceae bacterium]
MKKNIMMLLAGIVIGALLFGATLVYASTRTVEILAEFNDIKIVVNGKLIKSQQEPFVNGGRIFLPLRTVAEALQQQVNWEDNTAIITGGNSPKSLTLQDLFIPVNSGLKYSANSPMLAGEKEYKKGFYVTPTDTAADCKFTTSSTGVKQVSGSVVLDDNNEKNAEADVIILVDGKKVEKLGLKKGDPPKAFQVDLTGANDIVFRVEEGNGEKIDFLDMKLKY